VRRQRRVAAPLALAGLLLLAVGADAAPAELAAASGTAAPRGAGTLGARREGAVLVLSLPRAGATLARDGRGVAVRYEAAIDAAAMAALARQHAAWIRDLRYGYDSFYLEPAADIVVELAGQDDVHEIRLVPAPVPGMDSRSETAADDGSALRLDRLGAALRGRDGDHTGARAALRVMMEQRADDVPTIVELIEQERELGRWRDALALYDRALALDNDAAYLISGKAALLREHGSHVRASFELSDVEDEDRQLIWVLENRVHVDTRTVAGMRLEYRDVDDPTVQHPRGAIEQFDGRRALGSVYVEHAGPGPGDMRVEVHGADAGPGVTFGYRLGWNPGETRLQLDLWRPYWDFVEGIAHGGYRHRARVQHRLRTQGRLNAEVAAHASRYGLDGIARVADGLGAQLAASYRLFGDEPSVDLEYYFDTEYYGDVREGRIADGTRYQPVAFTNREIHQLHLVWNEQLTDYIRVGARGGYTWDRLNGEGRNLGAELVYAPLPDLEVGLRFYQSITAARGGANTLNSFGGFVLLRL